MFVLEDISPYACCINESKPAYISSSPHCPLPPLSTGLSPARPAVSLSPLAALRGSAAAE